VDPAIQVEGVSKRFRLTQGRSDTAKERFVLAIRRPRLLRTRSHNDLWALKDIDLEIDHGQTLGLIGANGSGKSTLLKVVAGILRPTTGKVLSYGRMASLLELGAGFHPDLTGRENIYMNAAILGLTRKETDRHFDAIVAFAGLDRFIDEQVKHYSSGMFVRLGFAVAIHVDPAILLVDEVLAVGDEAFQRKCLDRVRTFQREGRTIVFVTHAVDQVRQLCDRAVMLSEGKIRAEGKPAEVIATFRKVVHGDLADDPGGGNGGAGERMGTGELRIGRVTLLGGDGAARSRFFAGDEMVVAVDLEVKNPVDDPVVGIAIYDDRDQCLFGTNTMLREVHLGKVSSDARVSFRIHDLPLQEQRFYVTIGVHSSDDSHIYAWQDKAWSFEVINRGPDAGILRIPCEIEIEVTRANGSAGVAGVASGSGGDAGADPGAGE